MDDCLGSSLDRVAFLGVDPHGGSRDVCVFCWRFGKIVRFGCRLLLVLKNAIVEKAWRMNRVLAEIDECSAMISLFIF